MVTAGEGGEAAATGEAMGICCPSFAILATIFCFGSSSMSGPAPGRRVPGRTGTAAATGDSGAASPAFLLTFVTVIKKTRTESGGMRGGAPREPYP